MQELDRRLARGELLAKARQLHQQGDEAGAERLLQPLQPDDEVALMLAGWAAWLRVWSSSSVFLWPSVSWRSKLTC